MTRIHAFTYEFVDYIPDKLADGTVYVSIPYATVAHNCFCGCGSEVVTPLGPTDWSLVFDGDSISLEPSVGNWSLQCRSHYWIVKNRVNWAESWSAARIEATRERDRQAKAMYFGAGRNRKSDGLPPSDKQRRSSWQRLISRLGRRRHPGNQGR